MPGPSVSVKQPFFDRVRVLDGPVGTQLIERGFVPDGLLWTALAAETAPELLAAVQHDYLAAGADVLTANTFRISPYAFERAGQDFARARALMMKSVEIAKNVAAGRAFVAGSLAPLEDCYSPALAPPDQTLEREHARTCALLAEAACDLLLCETMGTAREAAVAVRSAREAGIGLVGASFISDRSGTKLLGGEDLLESARRSVAAGATLVLVNCVHSHVAELALRILQPLRSEGIALGAYSNAAAMVIGPEGTPVWENGSQTQPAELASHAAHWARELGCKLIGSCCGTSPAHIKAIAEAIKTGPASSQAGPGL